MSDSGACSSVAFPLIGRAATKHLINNYQWRLIAAFERAMAQQIDIGV
jgi:hypothetical protein